MHVAINKIINAYTVGSLTDCVVVFNSLEHYYDKRVVRNWLMTYSLGTWQCNLLERLGD